MRTPTETDARIRVLLVDDDEDDYVIVRDLISEVRNPRCQLTWCRNFEEGLEEVLRDRHDLYLLDYHLGADYGLDIVREARRSGLLAPMILLTGREDEDVDNAAAAAGAADYLIKDHLSAPLLGRSIRYALAQTSALEVFRQSEARFRAIIENSPDAVVLHRDRRIVYVNPAALRYLDFDDANAMLDTSIADLLHPDDIRASERVWHTLEREQSAAPMRELRFVRRNGETLTAEVAELCIKFEGEPAIMATVRDVTERKQLRARVMVSERMASLGTLAAGVAHEINNPLAYVAANIELSHKRVRDFVRTSRFLNDREVLDEVCAMLSKAQEGVDRVSLIVGDLKQFSRDGDQKDGAVDVHRVIETALSLAQNQIRHRAQITRDYGDIPPVQANEARLGQVFLNLLVNAAQSVPEGSAAANRITIHTRSLDNDQVLIEIRDTGAGIAPHLLERIFDPFFTTKRIGDGMGLGLSICHGIVSSFGGHIYARSQVGKGSCFSVTLPMARGACAERRAPEVTPLNGVAAATTARGRVLVVDDEPMIGDIVRRMLNGEHDVEVLTRGADVLEHIDSGRRYDAILCDLMMPDLTGMDIHHHLRTHAPEQAERMIFMTGGVFTRQAEEFLDAIANPLVEKPFNLKDLRGVVGEMIG